MMHVMLHNKLTVFNALMLGGAAGSFVVWAYHLLANGYGGYPLWWPFLVALVMVHVVVWVASHG